MDVHEAIKESYFMDMTIKISGSQLVTALYAKPMALYKYILPSSCHPPGALTSLVFGQVLRILQLSSRDDDINLDWPPSTTAYWTKDTRLPTSYPFLSKASTMPTITFPSPKLNKRK